MSWWGCASSARWRWSSGLLAVLKAGGAYVPLDPDYPHERLAFMMADAGLAVLLTHSTLAATVPIPAGLRRILLDREDLLDQEDTGAEATAAPSVDLDPEHLAYMIYTSGSTGQPKGAANTHYGLHNRLSWMQNAYRLTEQDVVLQKTPFSFDVSVWEFFWPLMTGARLAIAAPGAHRDPARLIATISSAACHHAPFCTFDAAGLPRARGSAGLRRDPPPDLQRRGALGGDAGTKSRSCCPARSSRTCTARPKRPST